MSNILFALYHDFTSNSAIHVHNFAGHLAGFGHSVAVAVPDNKETVLNLGEPAYVTANFAECDGTWDTLFPDGGAPDIVHAWTPPIPNSLLITTPYRQFTSGSRLNRSYS